MSKKELELVGWAWFSKNKKALRIGMRDLKTGAVDENLMFFLFVENLDRLRNTGEDRGKRSVEVYKSEPLERVDVPVG